ncbi:hypothetical protein BLA3211_07989 [Burkholderia aenigmatica]|uniref:Uncharacterized protein n=1 Tax=Burkholderia aenigmatica TaxID=2015348 RepID=A0A6J5JTA3_9BURK|nr:hypothetical protein BLA3211_07989 [Burkholderia aenigmatica]
MAEVSQGLFPRIVRVPPFEEIHSWGQRKPAINGNRP